MPSKKLWAYIAKLEKVIKQTMESSEEIAELVAKIQQEGIEVSLNCIALFSDPQGKSFTGPAAEAAGFTGKMPPGSKKPATRRGTTKGGKAAAPGKGKATPAGKGKGKVKPDEFKVTDADKEFLKQIGIRFD